MQWIYGYTYNNEKSVEYVYMWGTLLRVICSVWSSNIRGARWLGFCSSHWVYIWKRACCYNHKISTIINRKSFLNTVQYRNIDTPWKRRMQYSKDMLMKYHICISKCNVISISNVAPFYFSVHLVFFWSLNRTMAKWAVYEIILLLIMQKHL